MSDRPKIYTVRHKAKFSMRALMWSDLMPEQQQAATEKYFNGEGDPADYFNCEPDGFLVIDGVIYDIDAEATLDFDACRDAVELGRDGYQLRLLPSSVADGKGLAVRYQNVCDPVFHVYCVEVANV